MDAVNSCKGQIPCSKEELDLDLTLLGGQSFRWEKVESSNNCKQKWIGVAFGYFWELMQNAKHISFNVYWNTAGKNSSTLLKEYFEDLMIKYFRMDFDLVGHFDKWKSTHEHFRQTVQKINAVRVLDQEPFENIVSFICSQNNHIKRISSMIQFLCSKYGTIICNSEGKSWYTFPTLEAISMNIDELEQNLRSEKFGYRAKFISNTVKKINTLGGKVWFEKLRKCSYQEARLELVTLPGIGFKVADCICLMSLNHLEAVPIDTHIYKIAQDYYMTHLKSVKSVTPRIYDQIADHFRSIYGESAGWAQAVLFCSSLQKFQSKSPPKMTKKQKLKT